MLYIERGTAAKAQLGDRPIEFDLKIEWVY